MPQWIYMFNEDSGEQEEMPVATERELLDFCNKVRAAGGANILEALLPSQPSQPKSCLIANALNFACEVRGCATARDSDGRQLEERIPAAWGMHLPFNMSEEKAKELAAAIDCEVAFSPGNSVDVPHYVIVLPEEIGNAAMAFDNGDAFQEFNELAMPKPNDIMVVHLYYRDVVEILASTPPDTSPKWQEFPESQRNLIDALRHAQVETYE